MPTVFLNLVSSKMLSVGSKNLFQTLILYLIEHMLLHCLKF